MLASSEHRWLGILLSGETGLVLNPLTPEDPSHFNSLCGQWAPIDRE